MVVDLSREAIEARREAEARSGRRGGMTARQLIEAAGRHIDIAHRRMRAAQRIGTWKHAGKARIHEAHEAMVTAATQLEIAARVPLDQPYLHALSVRQVDECRTIVLARIPEDQDDAEAWARFAVAVNVQARNARTRTTQEK